jgi:cyclophilin family peptidyl-prolyl cis-trans isomerase/uncharacterized SAM-binding protein YcdF (DUF218 family)
MKKEAVVVLGCRIASAMGDPLAGAAGRRARAAAEIARARGAELVIATGGRRWGLHRRLEADALAEELERVGVDKTVIERERASRNTRENARHTAKLLHARGVQRVALVTCAWHLPRATVLFESEGFEVEPVPVPPGPSTLRVRAYRVVRERIATRLDRIFLVLAIALVFVACGRGSGTPDASSSDAGADAGADLHALAVAEDSRRADLVTPELQASRDVVVRRRAARALARIADAPSEAGLMRALGDEDAETAAWGAYGLGFSCKGHEDARVRAIVARSASVDLEDAGAPTTPVDASAAGGTSRTVIDLRFAISRALGKCGGAHAESTLAGWVRNKGKSAWAREQAAYGIGDIGAKRGALDDDTITALLDASADGVATALYPFARAERFNDAFAARLLDAAKKALGGPKSDTRVFAVRSLAKVGDASDSRRPGFAGSGDAIAELSRVATSSDFTWPERTDAMRSLAKLGDPGRVAAGDALAKIFPDPKDPFAVLGLGGDLYGEIVVALGALGQKPPANANRILAQIAAMRAPGDAPATLARRLAEMRCTAASLLSQGAYNAQNINACSAENSEPWERARFAALMRRQLWADRRVAWLALTKTEHLRVREEALAAVGGHPELGEIGLQALADALSDTKHPGVVAAATEIITQHPDRMLVLAAKERRNALDPNAPPPTATPQQEVSPVIAKALAAAIAFKWPEDAIETRAGLIDAAAALHATNAKDVAKLGCSDPNITMREHAAKALRALGEEKVACNPPPGAPVAKETNAPHGGKLVLETDAGTLSITFDQDLAPIASTRILDLAKAGFYANVVVHRVVPAFVVQLGDPQGDGYNGSGTSLRCETSPVPFGPLDVGIALAGRDTGSSQFFVTLGRFPHLDGDYARVGHAEGDWLGVAEGDVVKSVKVE